MLTALALAIQLATGFYTVTRLDPSVDSVQGSIWISERGCPVHLIVRVNHGLTLDERVRISGEVGYRAFF